MKKELLEAEGIRCQMEIQTDDKTAGAWGMPMGMEHLVRTYRLFVGINDKDKAEALVSSPFTEERFYIVLLDRNHYILRKNGKLPEEAIDSAASPKQFAFLGEYAAEEGVYQFFLHSKEKEKIALRNNGFSWELLISVLADPSAGATLRRGYIDVVLGGFEPPADTFGAWSFGSSPAMADSLGKLVTKGNKRATAGLAADYEAEQEPLPEAGEVSVILDGDGKPMAVIRTTEVIILPFREVTEEMAAEEGEGDLSLAYWQKEHKKYFSRSCRDLGLQFSEELEVVFERFELLKVFS